MFVIFLLFVFGFSPPIHAQYKYNNNNGGGGTPFYTDPFKSQRSPGGLLNQPMIVTSENDYRNRTGVVIALQLMLYSNPAFELPNNLTCACPHGFQCPYLRANEASCHFSFTTIISALNQSVTYIATNFVPLRPDGTVDLTQPSANWTKPRTLYLSSKPLAIDVFVHHLGVVIDKNTAALRFFNHLKHVDTFVEPLADYLPRNTRYKSGLTTVTRMGQLLATSLTLSYSVHCLNDYMGPNCDMTCKQSTFDRNFAVCRSNITAFYSICMYQISGQVDRCKSCYNGVSQDDQCLVTIAMPSNENLVPSVYRLLAIVLACLLFLSLLIIITMISLYCFFAKDNSPPSIPPPPPAMNTWTATSSSSASSKPLLSKIDSNTANWTSGRSDLTNQRRVPLAEQDDSHQSTDGSYTNRMGILSGRRREAQV